MENVLVPSATTSATSKRCRTLSQTGSTSRPQTSAEMTRALRPGQNTDAYRPLRSAPLATWWP
jgi:hypothetical protein